MSGTQSELLEEKTMGEKPDNGASRRVSEDLQVTVEVAERKVQENDRAKVLDNAYAAKSQLVGEAMSAIGMNRWQYLMWSVCGFSWIVDNIANYAMALTFGSVAREWTIPNITLSNIAFSLGGLIGSLFWYPNRGPMADIVGRRFAFNVTLFINGIFILAAGGVNNVVAYGAMFGVIGFACGGNVPITATMFLELVPTKGYFLLTILSAWWSVGALLSAGIGYGFISRYSCSPDETIICHSADNMGWRYTLYTLGSIVIFLAAIRLLIFRIPESPYYLLAHGRDSEAIAVVEYIAEKSNKPCKVTLEMLEQINIDYGHESGSQPRFTKTELFLKPFKQLSLKNLKPLFGTAKLALQTSLFTWLWAAAGLAYPLYTVFLPLYLSAKNAKLDSGNSISQTYKEYCYIAACTIPGPVLAGFVIETRFGRRYSLAISALITGMFLYLSTLAETNAAVVGFNCTATIVINFFLAIQYAYTPESFPATVRATASGLLSTVSYVCGIAAPIISNEAGISTSVPVYVSGGLFLLTGVFMFALPYETSKVYVM